MGAPNREIGWHTRPRRRSAGLTQAQLARQVGPTVDEAVVPRGAHFH
jgi:hypothetical protein